MNKIKTSEPKPLWKIRCTLGEGTLWVNEHNSIYFVDIKKKKICSFNIKNKKKKIFKVNKEIGFIAHEFQEVEQKIRGSSQFKPVEGVKDQMDANQGTPIYQKIHYEKITPILWGALKETIAKIENLEEKNKVYFNGRSTYKIIDLPDYWLESVHIDSITVQLTPIKNHQSLYVEKIVNNQIHINSEKRGERLDYFYNIYGEKK